MFVSSSTPARPSSLGRGCRRSRRRSPARPPLGVEPGLRPHHPHDLGLRHAAADRIGAAVSRSIARSVPAVLSKSSAVPAMVAHGQWIIRKLPLAMMMRSANIAIYEAAEAATPSIRQVVVPLCRSIAAAIASPAGTEPPGQFMAIVTSAVGDSFVISETNVFALAGEISS